MTQCRNGTEDHARVHQLRRLRTGVPEPRHLAGAGDLPDRPAAVHRMRRALFRGAVRQSVPGQLHSTRSGPRGNPGAVDGEVPQADDADAMKRLLRVPILFFVVVFAAGAADTPPGYAIATAHP